MLASTIAFNRFGLGARPAEQPASDPKFWLTRQFSSFDLKPSALAQVPEPTQVVAQLADYADAQQAANRIKRQMPQAAAMPMGEAQAAPDPMNDPMKKYLRQAIRDDYLTMNAARLSAAVATDTPFVERLVHFWA